MDNKKIYIIIPAYNEEKNIGRVLNGLKHFDYRLVVVDDGSSDRTGEIARAGGAVVLRHQLNRGQGAALETGDRYAIIQQADIIVHFDADGQFKADEIKEVIAPILKEEADAVFGSRFLGKNSNMPPIKKKIIFPLARLANKLFFNIKMTDPQSGFRALSTGLVKDLVIENDGMAHCSEILAKTFNGKYRVCEVPISVDYNEYGQKFSGGIRILKDLFISKIIR